MKEGSVVTNGGYDWCLVATVHSYSASEDMVPLVLLAVIRWVNIYIILCAINTQERNLGLISASLNSTPRNKLALLSPDVR